jgi:hypothetical protein
LRSKYRAVFSVLIVALGIGGFIAHSYLNAPVERTTNEILSIIEPATTIEVYRLDSKSSSRGEKIGHASVVGKAVVPEPKTAKQLKEILLSHLGAKVDPRQPQKGCPPIPTIAVRFIHAEQSVDVLICFSCYDLWPLHEKPYRLRDFLSPKNERQTLVKLTKTLFPGDGKIQTLKVVDVGDEIDPPNVVSP